MGLKESQKRHAQQQAERRAIHDRNARARMAEYDQMKPTPTPQQLTESILGRRRQQRAEDEAPPQKAMQAREPAAQQSFKSRVMQPRQPSGGSNYETRQQPRRFMAGRRPVQQEEPKPQPEPERTETTDKTE